MSRAASATPDPTRSSSFPHGQRTTPHHLRLLSLPALSRIVEPDRLRRKNVRIESPANPLQQIIVFRMIGVADCPEESCVSMGSTNVFWGAGARTSHAARIGAAVRRYDILEFHRVVPA